MVGEGGVVLGANGSRVLHYLFPFSLFIALITPAPGARDLKTSWWKSHFGGANVTVDCSFLIYWVDELLDFD